MVLGEQLSTELNKFRTDLIRNRRARKPLTFFDSSGLTQPTIEKITVNDGPIPVDAGVLAGGGDTFVKVVTPGSEPRDNFVAQDYITTDYEQALGQGANQSRDFSKTRTATEVRTVQGNASARSETEQDRIREYFVELVRKFDCVLQRTITPQEVTKILGQQGAQLWEQWKVLPGSYTYDILPDAGRYVDAQQYQRQMLDTYNLLRKDGRVNVEELLTMVARALNRDPAKLITPPPTKTMEPPKPTVSFNAIDLNDPVAGQVFLDFCANSGLKLSPETVQLMKAAHQIGRAHV